jgi:hypothetical protein
MYHICHLERWVVAVPISDFQLCNRYYFIKVVSGFVSFNTGFFRPNQTCLGEFDITMESGLFMDSQVEIWRHNITGMFVEPDLFLGLSYIHSCHQLCVFSFTGSSSDIVIILLTEDSSVYMFSFIGSGSDIIIMFVEPDLFLGLSYIHSCHQWDEW